MNIDELSAKMDEILSFAKKTHAKSVELEAQVESLKRNVDDLRERLTYREKVLVGWKDIATYLGFRHDERVRQLAAEPFDPLPAWYEGGNVVALASALDAYKARRKDHPRVAKLAVYKKQKKDRTIANIVVCEGVGDPS